MREGFTNLVDKVNEQGKIKAETSDISRQIESFGLMRYVSPLVYPERMCITASRNSDLNSKQLKKEPSSSP